MTAPLWVGVTDQTVIAGRAFDYRVPAYDADGDALTFSVVGPAPAWLGFDATTATLPGTPPVMAGHETVPLRANSGRGRPSDISLRSEELPCGKGCVSTWKSGESPDR